VAIACFIYTKKNKTVVNFVFEDGFAVVSTSMDIIFGKGRIFKFSPLEEL
jgi:hypothetical protein